MSQGAAKVVFLFVVILAATDNVLSSCPCSRVDLCNPISDTTRKEVFAFVLKAERAVWEQFEWSKLTTIVLVNFYDSELFCFAHEKDVRVVSLQDYNKTGLLDQNLRKKWILAQVSYAKAKFLDGVNIDFEDDIDVDSPEATALTQLVRDTTRAFHVLIPGSQVTFDIPYAPYNELGTGVDGRNFDFLGLADACDFLFIMSYDQRSQVFTDRDEGCLALANSDVFVASGGIQAFLDLGLAPSKLVFGQPWYGYDYVCTRPLSPDGSKCYIQEVPFRGVNCSDAAGHQVTYGDIEGNFLSGGALNWDPHSRTYFIDYVVVENEQNVTHQLWYDRLDSYGLKYETVTALELRGVGMWNANQLNYSNKQQVKDMWGALPSYRIPTVLKCPETETYDNL